MTDYRKAQLLEDIKRATVPSRLMDGRIFDYFREPFPEEISKQYPRMGWSAADNRGRYIFDRNLEIGDPRFGKNWSCPSYTEDLSACTQLAEQLGYRWTVSQDLANVQAGPAALSRGSIPVSYSRAKTPEFNMLGALVSAWS